MRSGPLRVLVGALVAAGLVAAAILVLTEDETSPQAPPGADSGIARVAPRLDGRLVDTIGVASFNAYHHLNEAGAKADWDRITRNPAIDLIGWQESKSGAWVDLYPDYVARGWETWHRPGTDGPHAEAVEVSLRHRESGMLVTLVNTHVIRGIETGHGWQDNRNAELARRHYRTLATVFDRADGDVVIGTGDYNWDYADDSTHRPAGGISRTVARHARSSYAALGLGGVTPTHGSRWIDYVWLADGSVRHRDGSGTAQFARHRSLGGFASDHHPLLAMIRLYGA